MAHSYEGINLGAIEIFWKQTYGVTKSQLDAGTNILSVLYCHTPWFKSGGEWHVQDYSKVGKAKSVYNRIRSATQVGASPNLHWVIETKASSRLEQLWKTYASRQKLNEGIQLDTNATELVNLDCPYKQLESFLRYIDWKNNNLVGRVIVFKDIYNIKVRTKEDWSLVYYDDDPFHRFNIKPYNNLMKRVKANRKLFEINA